MDGQLSEGGARWATTYRLEIGSATAEEARAFLVAYQRSRPAEVLPALDERPEAWIVGVGWHVGTPSMSPERAAAMMAILAAGEDQDEPMRVREHHGFGHGLRPGTAADINCSACQREDAR